MLHPRIVRDHADVVRHFDALAKDYDEGHGDADRLLRYRLEVIHRAWDGLRIENTPLLEIGCGPGTHLLALTAGFSSAVGLDISPGMVEIAGQGAATSECPAEFRVDPAEELATVENGSIGAVLCVGAFEHMLDRRRVLRQVSRVLLPGGVFVCLTHNGDYLWYSRIAPAMGIETRHLSTDRSIPRKTLKCLVADAGLQTTRVAAWTFVARGDMPGPWGNIMTWADRLGRVTGISSLRGGLALTAVKPPRSNR
jgi:ubiquinone/menaquinone biosynthesis C-methylase UbiE